MTRRSIDDRCNCEIITPLGERCIDMPVCVYMFVSVCLCLSVSTSLEILPELHQISLHFTRSWLGPLSVGL